MKILDVLGFGNLNLKGAEKKITANCKEILALYQRSQKVFYRGAWKKPDIFIGQNRANRKPLNSSQSMHLVLDNAFNKAGFPFNRSSCSFATSEKHHTKVYGIPYVIFPFDDCKYIWSPQIMDVTAQVLKPSDYKLYHNATRDHLGIALGSSYQEYIENMAEFYKLGDVRGALHSGNEVMINGYYVAIKADLLGKQFMGIKFQA